MHSAVIILTLVSIAYAGTVPYLERISKVTERQVTVNGGNDNSFFNIHDIPTYPDYVNTTQANSPRTESHSIPTTTAVQISGWSFRNVVSSLSPFVTSLFLPGSHISSFLLRFLVVVLLSVASAALICVYTPTCNVNFPGKVKIKELTHTYITPKNLDFLTLMVTNAFDKYNFMQFNEVKDDARQDKSQK